MLWGLTIGMLLVAQGPGTLEQERVRLPMSLTRLCERAVDYVARDDRPRARKVIRRFDAYARAYDRKWGCDLSGQLQELASSTDHSTIVGACHLLFYAEVVDRLRVLEDSAEITMQRARHNLLAAKAAYAHLAATVRQGADGVRRRSVLARYILDLASVIPRRTGDARWKERFASRAGVLRRLLAAALPQFDRAIRALPGQPGNKASAGKPGAGPQRGK